MFFEVLDHKRECKAFYLNGSIEDQLPQESGVTWSMHDSLWHRDDVILSAALNNWSLESVCPSEFKELWTQTNKKYDSFVRAFSEAKIDLNEYCIWDLMPERFLIEMFSLKMEILQHLNNGLTIPDHYDINKKIVAVCNHVENNGLRLNKKALYPFLAEEKAKKLYSILLMSDIQYVQYIPFNTITNRLSIKTGSFPILNLKKEYRSIIEPMNDFFLELDYNAAEVRTVIALQGKEQPKEDVYSWIAANLIKTDDRKQAKKETLMWLYNPENQNSALEGFLPRQETLEQFYSNGIVETIFKRKIESDDFHALNYTVQSTASDNALDRVYEIISYLKQKKTKSHVAFLMHDSIVLDLKKEDMALVTDLVRLYKNTRLGNFPVNVLIGSNFGNMVEQGTF